MDPLVIAIDGPAGSGKSTLARRLAAEFGLPYLNTGAMYRALTAGALSTQTDLDDGPALARLATSIRFSVDRGATPPALAIDGAAPTPALTSPDVEASVSRVARHPEVRVLMREEQRRLGAGGAVLEGRDIGSVVFPDADVKVFLSAGVDERIRRRAEERRADAERLGRSLERRDDLDARVNPFVPAADAIVVDTDHLDADGVFDLVAATVRDRIAPR